MNDSSNANSPEEQLPHEVVAALRERFGPNASVPESLDKAILADAADHLRTISPPMRRQPVRRRKTWIAISTGSLAAAMLLFVMWPDGNHQAQLMPEIGVAGKMADTVESPTASRLAVASDDVDQNGTVNILDAFALARTIESNSANAIQWDQNGDGILNNSDVQQIAMTAVTL